MFGVKTKIINKINSLRWHWENYKAYSNRDKIITSYIKSHKIRKLTLGCWPYPMKSWLNTDLYGNEKLVPLDLTKKFPIGDLTFHYIHCEHTIEHFNLNKGIEILKECYRILKPGGKIRLATPDLKFVVNLYNSKKTPLQKEFIHWSTNEFLKEFNIESDTLVVNNIVRAWGHEFIYDFKTLKLVLERVGFTNVQRFKPGQSHDPNLKNIEMHWKSSGRKDFNDLQTFVVEATKP